MSQITAARATARPAGRTSGRPVPTPQRLRVVSAPQHTRSRAGVAILCLVMLAAGLVGILLLNINLTHGSYELYRLQSERDRLHEQQQALAERLDAEQAPQELARHAASLGMVPAPGTAYLHLSNGAVTGAAIAARPSLVPTVVHTP